MAGYFFFCLLFTFTTYGSAQFFDLFQALQPIIQPPRSMSLYDVTTTRRPKTKRPNNRTPVSIIRDDTERDRTKPTPKPNRKTSQRVSSKSDKVKAQMDIKDTIYFDPNINTINYFTTTPKYQTTKRTRPTQSTYTSTYRPQSQFKPYTTQNPFFSQSGVKPAIVNGPPITNKPVTEKPAFGPDTVTFPDETPEIINGPNEDYMSEVDKRRYVELAERMCDKYKQYYVKQLEAIPLVPSPSPVRVNVSSCAPTKIPLVVGGRVVTIKEFPHMALLGWNNVQSSGYSWKCGGSLISERYVLTAAHCAYQDRDNSVLMGPPRVVQLGSSYLNDPGAVVVKVKAAIRHPKYKLPKSYYDLALLRLADDVMFSEVIKPACLGVPPPVDEHIIATGWGRTEFGGDQSHELRSVSIPIWDMKECFKVLGTSRKLPDGPSPSSQVCAGEKRGGKDTCQGDSGGPAQMQDDCIWRIVAVTSIGRSCGAPQTPALYATVQRAFIAAVAFTDTDQDSNQRRPDQSNVNISNGGSLNKPSTGTSWGQNNGSKQNRNGQTNGGLNQSNKRQNWNQQTGQTDNGRYDQDNGRPVQATSRPNWNQQTGQTSNNGRPINVPTTTKRPNWMNQQSNGVNSQTNNGRFDQNNGRQENVQSTTRKPNWNQPPNGVYGQTNNGRFDQNNGRQDNVPATTKRPNWTNQQSNGVNSQTNNGRFDQNNGRQENMQTTTRRPNWNQQSNGVNGQTNNGRYDQVNGRPESIWNGQSNFGNWNQTTTRRPNWNQQPQQTDNGRFDQSNGRPENIWNMNFNPQTYDNPRTTRRPSFNYNGQGSNSDNSDGRSEFVYTTVRPDFGHNYDNYGRELVNRPYFSDGRVWWSK